MTPKGDLRERREYTVQMKRIKERHSHGVPPPLPTITFFYESVSVCQGGGGCLILSLHSPFFPPLSPLSSPQFCLPCRDIFYWVSQIVYTEKIVKFLDKVRSDGFPSTTAFSTGNHRSNQQITLLLLSFDVWLCKVWPIISKLFLRCSSYF